MNYITASAMAREVDMSHHVDNVNPESRPPRVSAMPQDSATPWGEIWRYLTRCYGTTTTQICSGKTQYLKIGHGVTLVFPRSIRLILHRRHDVMLSPESTDFAG